MGDVVSLTDVHAVYEGERHAALIGVTLAVSSGEQVAITGPNGAGKTTVLEVINGLLPITSGCVHVLGVHVTVESHRVRSRIAYVPQNLFFPPDTPFLVGDVVLTARFAKIGRWRFPGSDDRQAVRTALAAVRLDGMSRRPVGRLSGGQQRRVLIARALAQDAELLLLDEPTANLDPDAKQEVAKLVVAVRAELSAAAVVVTHDAGPLLEACERSVTMEAGKVVRETRRAASPVGSHR